MILIQLFYTEDVKRVCSSKNVGFGQLDQTVFGDGKLRSGGTSRGHCWAVKLFVLIPFAGSC